MITKAKGLKGMAGAAVVALALGLGVVPAARAQYGPPPPAPGYGRGYAGGGYGGGGWDAPPPEMREVMRQGFHDGIIGAQRDVENHRRPDVRNRDEFRHPNVPGFLRRDYRDGFRRGYGVAMSHLLNGPRPY